MRGCANGARMADTTTSSGRGETPDHAGGMVASGSCPKRLPSMMEMSPSQRK